MLPQRFEYLLLLCFLVPLLLAFYEKALRGLIRSPIYWTGLLIFYCFCLGVESLALHRDWWRFNDAKIVGLAIAGIPLEEHLMFIGFYTLVTAHWNLTSDLD